MVKTKEDWEENLKEFEKMLESNNANIAATEKNIEDITFFIDAVKEKLKTFK